MSIMVSTAVWAHSKRAGSALLMLLAIADFADDAGRAHPSVSTLARKCRTSVRHANRLLVELRDSGELGIALSAGPAGCNRYRITLGGAPLKPASPPGASVTPDLHVTSDVHVTPDPGVTLTPTSRTPDAHVLNPLTPTSDEPSLNRHEPSERARMRATSSDRKRRPTRMRADWRLPDTFRDYCAKRRPDLDPEQTAEDFRDYWLGVSGDKGLKLDWLATWRRWVRNQRQPDAGRRGAALHADDIIGGRP